MYLGNVFPVGLADNEAHGLVLTIDLLFDIAGDMHVIKDGKFPRRESECSNAFVGHGSVCHALDDESRYRRGSCSLSLFLRPMLSHVGDVSLKENMNHVFVFCGNHDVNHDFANTWKVGDLIAILLFSAGHWSSLTFLVPDSLISQQFNLEAHCCSSGSGYLSEPNWLVYSANPTAPTLCTWSLSLSNR